MAITLIEMVNKVLRATGQRPNKTAFAETDSSAFLRDRINDAVFELYQMAPTTVDADGTLTLPSATRSVAAVAGLDPYRIYDWGWRINDPTGDIPLQFVDEKMIIQTFPLYETHQGPRPVYVYIANNLPSFYPLLEAGADSLTIQYKYPANVVALTTTTATFPFADGSDEMRFIELYAKFEYEMHKLMGNPDKTEGQLETTRAGLFGKYATIRGAYLVGNRRLGA